MKGENRSLGSRMFFFILVSKTQMRRAFLLSSGAEEGVSGSHLVGAGSLSRDLLCEGKQLANLKGYTLNDSVHAALGK